MKDRNLIMRMKAYTGELFFNSCKWCLLVIAYALVAMLIVMSPDPFVKDGVEAAQVSYTIDAYDYQNSDAVMCMGPAQPEEENNPDVEEDTRPNAVALSDMAMQENTNAVVPVFAKVNTVEAINVNIMDSVVYDKTVKPATPKAEPQKKIEDKPVVKQEAAIKTNVSSNQVRLSNTDRNVLLRIVEAEATGEDVKGKMLVASVVLNRVKSGKFPNTVEQVVFQKNGSVYQFSPIRDGRYYKVNISQETKEAVNRVLEGEDHSEGALYFMSRSRARAKNVSWFDRALTMVFKYGTHEFYK